MNRPTRATTLVHGLRGGLRGVVRPEDALLVGWTLLVIPLVATARNGEAPFGIGGPHPAPVGLIYVIAAAGAVACLLTRGRGEPIPDTGRLLTPGTYARFPFMVGVGILAGEGAESVGLPLADQLMGLVFVAAVVGLLVPGRLPALEPVARRALVTPIILIGASIFEGLSAEIWSGITPGEIVAGFEGMEPTFVAFVLVLLAFGSLAWYAMFVFGPRQVAEVEGSWAAWAIRFVLFLASVVLGVSWLRLVA